MDANLTIMAKIVPKRIGILPIPGFALMSYASVVEPLRAANLLSGETVYETLHFTMGTRAQSSGVAAIDAGSPIGGDPGLDLLFVVAGGDPAAFSDGRVLAWLRQLARRGVVLGGVSGGPVILARAGLMAGRRMTVHWEHAPALSEISPGLLVERNLYVVDRDRVTCAGGTAPLDLMHALIAEHHGGALARRVSDWFLHTDIRPSGGPQRSGLAERIGTRSAPVLDAVAAMENHIADPLSLEQLAGSAGTSPRNLNRLFQQHLTQTVMEFYRGLRLDLARRLLLNAPLSVTEIALATGFASSAHFSRAFSARWGYPPRATRQRQVPAET